MKLRDDADFRVRHAAVSALSSHVGGDAEIREALLVKLRDDASEWVREAAVRALSSQVGSDVEIREAIREASMKDAFDVRAESVEALMQLPEEILAERTDIDTQLREWLNLDVYRRLLPLNVNRLRETQQRIAGRFAARLPADRALREQVLGSLEDVRWSSRLGAVFTLSAWPGGPPPEIIDRIVRSLDDRRGLESYPARLTAAGFLINRTEYSAAAVDLCLEALDYGTQPWEFLPRTSPGIRKQAALTLGQLEPLRYDAGAYERLLRVMIEDEDGDVRDAAYDALGRLALAREQAQ